MKKLFLHSNFDSISGYGISATYLAIELQKQGIDVYPIAKSVGLDMPEEFLNLLMKKYPIGQHIDYYVNMDTPNNLGVSDNFNFIEKKIAFTMWEQTRMTKEFKKKHFKAFDNIFVPCSMNIEPFGKLFKEENIKVNFLGVDIQFYSPVGRNFCADKLKVCMNGALTFRKGVDILIDVMLDDRIKKLPIEFHLKNSQKTIHPKIAEINPNIHVYEGIWTKEQVKNFYNDNHIMICPNRGEGFNQPALEFLATGGVVITHDWGGHQTWANPEYCKIIPYKLVPVKEWKNVNEESKWAEVNKEDVIKALLDLYGNRPKLVNLSHNAIKMVNFYSYEKVSEKFIMNLKELV